MIYLYFGALIVSFALLFRSACLFVDGATGMARILNISKMVIGIVLVGIATTAPEFFVSVISAFLGKPEFALGNAVGSVICDDGIALALAALLAPAAILINCRVLKVVGVFLLAYILLLRRREFRFEQNSPRITDTGKERERISSADRSLLKRLLLRFMLGLAGVIASSYIVVWAARHIAEYFSLSETIIGLLVLAIGTSLPEISTCITAAIKGEGEIAVGNIIGADILNVLWIIGVSAVVNPITVELKVMNFSFPYMILIVLVMLISMRIRCRLGKVKGLILLALYALYVFLALRLFT